RTVVYVGGRGKSLGSMFKLSKKADYGLIAVKHLALHRRDHACSASEIAEEYGISATLMAKVLQKLAHKSIVAAKHGSSGGYQLSKDPSQITALDVISAIDGPVLEAMLPYFTNKFGNAASRNHSFGWAGEEAVENGRQQIASLINATSKEIIFTSGATESDNLMIKGIAEMFREKGNHVITQSIEHKAVLDTCKNLEKHGFE